MDEIPFNLKSLSPPPMTLVGTHTHAHTSCAHYDVHGTVAQAHSRRAILADLAQSRKPFGSFGNGSGLANENSRPGNGTTFGSGFSNTSAGWNGGIWSNSAIGSGIKGGSNDSGRVLGDYNTR